MSVSVGQIGPFDVTKDNWESYVDRLEQYYIVNDIKPGMRVAILITVIGSGAYELLVNLCTPDKPSTKSFEDLVKVMKGHLQPGRSLLSERFKFRQQLQKHEESIADYVARLKESSKYCNFTADTLKENLRDQFVCGLMSEHIRQRLFAEDDITFDKAFKLASSMEAAEANAALVEDCTRGRGDRASLQAGVNQLRLPATRRRSGQQSELSYKTYASGGIKQTGSVGSGGGPSGTSGAGREKRRDVVRSLNKDGGGYKLCKVCGSGHASETCKYKLYVCRICNREGHLKKMCPNGQRSASLHNVVENKHMHMDHTSSDSDEVNNFSINTNKVKLFGPYSIEVCVENIPLNMEIDTGSAISCISYDCYLNNFVSCQISKSDLVLRYYTGEIVTPKGKIRPLVSYHNVSKYLDLYIIDSAKTSLLGRQWLHELQINLSSASCYYVKNPNVTFNIDEFSSRYSKVFEDGLGKFTGGKVGFSLREGAKPVFLRARPLPYALREPVEAALDQLVADGVLTPVSSSDWATPIVPVMKKDGSIRVCADYKLTLNKVLEVDRFPLPRVDDLLAKLHGGEKFTKLDLSQAYAQFELDDSKKFTVINTSKGLYMYNRLIYGLASSPGIFQRKLEQLFADIPRVGIFLDDLIITGENDASHLETLHKVFYRLMKYGLKIKREKCTFFAESVTYLGYIINKHGVHTCPDKIKAIKEVKTPNNVSELRSFLGLVMYYARFVPDISTVLSPLYYLLKKDVKFEWQEQHEKAFNTIKKLLISSGILAHYSGELPLVLTTDASSVGVGAVISHIMPDRSERPIAYASRVLTSVEKGYSQIEKEGLAIIYGVRKFHQYLYGRRFILRTDHKPLVSIFGEKSGIPVMAASRMQRWAVILAGYSYDIKYVRSDNNAADALSRLPIGIESEKPKKPEVTYLNFIQNFLPITCKTVQECTAKDELLRKVLMSLKFGWPSYCKDKELLPYFNKRNELYLEKDCIVWGYRIILPNDLRKYVLNELHTGHLGIVKMKSLARSIVWWPGIDADIESTCRQCATCAAESSAPPRAPPQPWPYIPEPWSRLHIDFLGPIHGKTFLILIDSTTKWIEAFHMQGTTASAVIKVLRETFARFGLPREVVSDNGPPFSSKEMTDFMKNNGIKMTFSPIYHPSSNGAAEGAVKLCKRAVKKSLRDGCDLDAALQSYLMAYRNVDHSTTGTSPAMLLQRRPLRSRLDLLRGDLVQKVQDKVREKQRKQVEYARGRERPIEVGERVWARNYTGGKKWLAGQVESKEGSRLLTVGSEDGPPLKRHVDQVRKRLSSTLCLPSSVSSTNNEDDHSSGREDEQGISPVVERGTTTGLDITNIPNSSPPVELPKRVRKTIRRYGLEFD